MASGYDTTAFLLDRANIHDTATKMYMLSDLREFDRLAEEVFAKEVLVDYSAVFGTEPSETAGTAIAKRWSEMIGNLDSSQHIMTSLLIDLPRPDPTASPPQTAKLIANVSVTLCRKAAKGDPMMRNGGRAFLDLIRTEERENPWRIRGFRPEPAWYSGNWGVYGKSMA